MKRMLLVGLALVLASSAQAEQYSDDDLCRVIGETRVTALQPRDRLFFEKKCICFEDVCAASASASGRTLARNAKAAADIKRKQDACMTLVAPLLSPEPEKPKFTAEGADEIIAKANVYRDAKAVRNAELEIAAGCQSKDPDAQGILTKMAAHKRARAAAVKAQEEAKRLAEQEEKDRRDATDGARKPVREVLEAGNK